MPQSNTHPNREAWLGSLVDRLRPHFAAAGYDVPKNIRISCGFPTTGALSKGLKWTTAEVWGTTASKGGQFEIFMSPRCAGPVEIAAIVVHEICHTIAGIDAKHGKEFRTVGRAVGLVKPWTATTASPELEAALTTVCAELGPYPHDEMDPWTISTAPKKQGTRLLKAECLTDACGYTVRVTKKWASIGAPLCPVGDHGEMTIEWPDGEETAEEEGEDQ